MSCACRKAKREQKLSEAKQVQAEPAIEVEQVEEAKLPIVDDIKPTTQCIACAQKHLDEAWTMFHEYGYSNENRRFVRGNLRAIVLHTYLEWKSIATLARECALLVQEARDDEADLKMRELCELVDNAFYEANPEIAERLKK